ncbi:CheY-like chemotaxis protein [Methanolinea mesophila]|uniref:response regulator n=1 Tax=Methanolinea mesophila TaxID=547055 RepID=UPI001AE5DD9B|nr:CheY-like chemotaxis protein [Methanolinea mesophila]
MSGVKGRVLVVDDNAYIVEGLTEILKRKEYFPIPCRGGEEALQILKSTEVDVMLLDISMQPLDGWKTLERVRTDPSIADTPAIIFSARKFLEHEAEECHWRVDAVLAKPINTRDLIEAIEKAIKRTRAPASVQDDNDPDLLVPWPGDVVSLAGDASRDGGSRD